ncbi:hypothetical protein C427_3461 [Paraglaciecola psychrophila 170]|uniref:Uncharacterized protein n=1 Tax=Paraglaciecola psychrophila 170 TaxID=1129794 RepID=K7AKU8_9ALTE|nr:hypothetical protein C427_3461 [Paraglaciecola psychrophila 170]GAC36075.1 hypothetical protein GPSY_0433 [Paraglaciecola psychrophila 170]
MAFFTQHSCCTTYFLPLAAKSKQKCCSPNYVLNPIISDI